MGESPCTTHGIKVANSHSLNKRTGCCVRLTLAKKNRHIRQPVFCISEASSNLKKPPRNTEERVKLSTSSLPRRHWQRVSNVFTRPRLTEFIRKRLTIYTSLRAGQWVTLYLRISGPVEKSAPAVL